MKANALAVATKPRTSVPVKAKAPEALATKAKKAPPEKPTLASLTKALTEKQQETLKKLAVEISACDKDASSATKSNYEAFAKKARACSKLQEMLGDGNYPAYMAIKFKYQKSHASRWALAGEVLAVASPAGDDKFLSSEAHVRPLTGLKENDLKAVLARLKQWQTWSPTLALTSAWCEAAVQLQKANPLPDTEPDPKAEAVEKVLKLFRGVKASLPASVSKKVADDLTKFEMAVREIGRHATTGISWTEATWNPLHGCAYASQGCKFCYAAKQMATRLKHRYPGLAEERVVKEEKLYFFTNKILLDPKDLAEPLADRTPKRYFVNSMSDLFHEGVREDFINAVFDVMERAWWHQYQILTKRPERMATYSQRRYADREPPPHIWLGATIENQEEFDKRIKHLAATKTAVPWLSCEPLLGLINLGDKKQVEWVVVGGESGSTRKMEKEWATSLRDQCEKLGVNFFFKQWGDYDENGIKIKRGKKKSRELPLLDKAVHGDYPMEINLDLLKRAGEAKEPDAIWKLLRGCLQVTIPKPKTTKR
ncbi:MAG: phage Gp37/Gp68 family protein [Acidobacteriia bacterium]|nr:phage Gp37/Gp68 family protein [Terriglobia bacterium]